MSENKFIHRLRVRYSEIDGQRVVFNAHYMTYVEVALHEYLREVLGPYHAMIMDTSNPFEIVLVKAEMEFLGPARLDDVLAIECQLVHVGNSSFSMEYLFRRDGEEQVLVKARKTYVSVDLEEGKSRPFPPQIRQRLLDNGNMPVSPA